MKRIVIAVSALLGAFVISFTGYFLVDNTCNKLENHLWEICTVAQNRETEKAIVMSDDAVSLWEEVHGLVESFIRHEETDKLEELIKSLPVYAQQGNMERLEQQSDLAIDEIHHLIRSEKPLLSNIF
jgi:hypothetical protein